MSSYCVEHQTGTIPALDIVVDHAVQILPHLSANVDSGDSPVTSFEDPGQCASVQS